MRRRSAANAGARVTRSLQHSRTKRRFDETRTKGSLGTWTRGYGSDVLRDCLHIGEFKKDEIMIF